MFRKRLSSSARRSSCFLFILLFVLFLIGFHCYGCPLLPDFMLEFPILYSQRRPKLRPNKTSEKWPPSDPLELFDPRTGYFNLTLPVQVRNDPDLTKSADWVVEYVNYLKHRFQGQTFEGSDFRQLVQMDERTRTGAEEPNFYLYPQAIDLRRVVDAVKTGNPVEQAPINNPELLAITIPRYVCSSDRKIHHHHYDLVVLIKSCIFCFEKREHQRKTVMNQKLWDNFSVGFVFVMGQPVFEQVLQFNFTNLIINLTIELPNENPADVMHQLYQEIDKYGDILVGSFEDNYYNLSMKQITGYRWASAFCHGLTDMFMFMDINWAVIPQNLIKFMRNLPKRIRPLVYGGMHNVNQYVVRPNTGKHEAMFTKCSVSHDEIPWSAYPPFIPSTVYLIGPQLLEDVSIGHAFTRFFRLEDVFQEIILRKLNRFLVEFDGFTDIDHNVLPDQRKAISMGMENADRLYDWSTGRFRSIHRIH